MTKSSGFFLAVGLLLAAWAVGLAPSGGRQAGDAPASAAEAPGAEVAGVFFGEGRRLLASIERFNVRPDDEEARTLRSAIFAYSRSGNFKETRAVLKAAVEAGLFSTKEYFGELAHMVGVDTPEAVEVVREIMTSGSDYGMEVLFFSLATRPAWMDTLSVDERKYLVSALEGARPVFGDEVSALGMSDVYRYEMWLKALHLLVGNEAFADHLADQVLNKVNDPREFHALVHSGHYDLLRRTGKTGAADLVLRTLRKYRESYPDNDASEIILAKLK